MPSTYWVGGKWKCCQKSPNYPNRSPDIYLTLTQTPSTPELFLDFRFKHARSPTLPHRIWPSLAEFGYFYGSSDLITSNHPSSNIRPFHEELCGAFDIYRNVKVSFWVFTEISENMKWSAVSLLSIMVKKKSKQTKLKLMEFWHVLQFSFWNKFYQSIVD